MSKENVFCAGEPGEIGGAAVAANGYGSQICPAYQLVQQEVGMGHERVRGPRLVMAGAE